MKKYSNISRILAAAALLMVSTAANAQQGAAGGGGSVFGVTGTPANSCGKLQKVRIIENINGVHTMRDTMMVIRGADAIPEFSTWRKSDPLDTARIKMLRIYHNTDSLRSKAFQYRTLDGDFSKPLDPKVYEKLQEVMTESVSEALKNVRFRVYHSDKMTPQFLTDSAGRRTILLFNSIDSMSKPGCMMRPHNGVHSYACMPFKSCGADTTVVINKLVLEVHDLSSDEKETLLEMAQQGPEPNQIAADLALEDVKIYPNPSSGQFNLSFVSPRSGELLIRVIDALGREVYRDLYSQFNGRFDKEINLAQQPKGVYYLQVIQDAMAYHKRLVLQ